ncbi:Crp/Fnr family transcriptional regulator [Psychromonas sp. Urea-02u-13]|uniref:Crp/Fnr family transcriptional regulator n=1 Tax=Psychromonas sp. Urea-02u-13 TaxID=2058326 RepID=UPI000C32743D|nr:Crp/Fnr family transcriptional regulator [Psychromonas sp. Urea-02u-13]PKG39238.1 Crp/Fnr family transcriptional regulator [Psychromonas sp. Urea-02u-13]
MLSITQINLQKSLLFKNFSMAEFYEIGRNAKLKSVKQGQHLFREGDSGHYFYFIKSGEISLYRYSPEGDEKVFQILSEGDTLAEAVMFMQPALYPVNAKAQTDCEVVVFPQQALVNYCHNNPNFMMQIMAAMSDKLYQAINRVDQLTLKNAGQRLVSYLLELSGAQKSEWLTLPVSYSVLAGQLNITPETLSRLFKRFRQAGVISGKREIVVLLDVEAMCKLTNLPYIVANKDLTANNEALEGCCNLSLKWF